MALMLSTMITKKADGAAKIQGKVVAERWPSAIKVPSEVSGDWTPKPKNDRSGLGQHGRCRR